MEIIQLNLLVCDALNIMMQYLSFRLHVTVELTSNGLLTVSRMTVRSRQSSEWRTTCLSAACCNSSSWMSRQSGESQRFSHWPEGGSKIQIYNVESFYLREMLYITQTEVISLTFCPDSFYWVLTDSKSSRMKIHVCCW